jgi:regulatory protein YycI of two-component signal transduction system YycFG
MEASESEDLKKSIALFVAGMLTVALVYFLVVKPKNKELPTIWDEEVQHHVKKERDANKEIEKARTNKFRIREKYQKIKPNDIDDTGRDSLIYSAIKKGNRARLEKGLDTL